MGKHYIKFNKYLKLQGKGVGYNMCKDVKRLYWKQEVPLSNIWGEAGLGSRSLSTAGLLSALMLYKSDDVTPPSEAGGAEALTVADQTPRTLFLPVPHLQDLQARKFSLGTERHPQPQGLSSNSQLTNSLASSFAQMPLSR